jgi:outer membrane protein OmpA-like peptidoglycan-associated protein
VRREFMPRINDLARTLNSRPFISVQIIGHADALGSDAYNQELSERRAQAVGARLLDYGVPFSRIDATGRGEWEPIATNATEWGRARNRRVEIRLLAAGGPKALRGE